MFIKLYEQREEEQRFERPSWMKNSSRVNYEDIKDVSSTEIIEVVDQFNKTERLNNQISRLNRKLFDEASEVFIYELEQIGVTVKGTRGGILKPFSDTIREVGYEMTGRSHPAKPNPSMYHMDKEVRVNGNLADRLIRLKAIGEREEKNKRNKNKMFITAVQYMTDNKIEIPEDAARNDIIFGANDHAKQVFTDANFPKGTDMDLDDNYCECGSWTVGEHRCSCGSRQVYLEVIGDIINGFYAIAEVN